MTLRDAASAALRGRRILDVGSIGLALLAAFLPDALAWPVMVAAVCAVFVDEGRASRALIHVARWLVR